jgi:hypothetical protein
MAGSAARRVLHPTGVAKQELNIIKLMTEKAAKLDRDTFGVDGAHGPWHSLSATCFQNALAGPMRPS